MEKTASRKVAIAGVFVLVIFVLVLLLVPTIMAEDPGQVGNADENAPEKCFMRNLDGAIVGPAQVEVDIIPRPGIVYPDEYPEDIVVLLRCRTTFDNEEGIVRRYSGTLGTPCLVYPGSSQLQDLTTMWTETIKASGDAVLTCNFKGNAGP